MQSVNESLLKVIKVPHLNALCIYTCSVRLSNAVFFCVGTIETVRRTACAKMFFFVHYFGNRSLASSFPTANILG